MRTLSWWKQANYTRKRLCIHFLDIQADYGATILRCILHYHSEWVLIKMKAVVDVNILYLDTYWMLSTEECTCGDRVHRHVSTRTISLGTMLIMCVIGDSLYSTSTLALYQRECVKADSISMVFSHNTFCCRLHWNFLIYKDKIWRYLYLIIFI